MLSLVAGLLLSDGACAAAAPAVAQVRRPVRHMILVEDTKNMDRQRKQSADIVSRLILQGFGQRARPGDGVELWLVDDQVRTDVFERFTWDRSGAVDRSNLAYRLIRDLRPKGTTAVVGRAVSSVGATNSTSGPTLVYLVTSGTDSLLGTPYDETVNALFFQHRESMRKARNPFVTVLAAQDGAWVGHGVTPGDRTPFIPPLPAPKPQEVPPAVAPKKDALQQPSPAPIPATTNKPAPLSVEEISRQIREQAAEKARQEASPRATPPSSPAPATNDQATLTQRPGPLSVEEISRQIREQAAEKARQAAQSNSALRSPVALATPGPAAQEAPAIASEPAVDVPSPSGLPVLPPASFAMEPQGEEALTEETFHALDGTTRPAQAQAEEAVVSLPPRETTLGVTAVGRGRTDPAAMPSPGMSLWGGLVLLGAAGLVGLILIRILRHRRSPSLITESFQRLREPQQPYTGSRR